MISPSYEVQIWNFNEEIVVVKLLTLMTWKAALKSELAGCQVTPQPVFPIVRKFLSAPNNYPKADLYAHIRDSYNDIKKQLGV
jgi:hypothetical protein